MNKTEQDILGKIKSWGRNGSLTLAVLVLGLSSFTTVPEGTRGVKTRFSEVVSVVTPGLNFKLPFIESIHPVSVMADAVTITNAEGATKDAQPVHTSLTVRYHIQENQVKNVYSNYSRDGNMDNYVGTAAMESFKASTAHYGADELIVQRQQASDKMLSTLQTKLNQFGLTVTSVDVQQFAFSAEYMKAVNSKVTEEQQKLAEENKLARIQVEEQQKVVKAKAAAEATVATAKGDAEAMVANAKAKAEATRLEAAALAANGQILEIRRIEVAKIQAERWDGVLPSTVLGNAVPMINLGK